MLFFFGVIVVGFVYLWRFGYLDWVRAFGGRERGPLARFGEHGPLARNAGEHGPLARKTASQ